MARITNRARPLRDDASRNYRALLRAGKMVFSRIGTGAPMGEIAQEAGVSRGTLYRHFPSKDHLFAAILQERVDALELSASKALANPDPRYALRQWLREYDRIAAEYPGMSAQVGGNMAVTTSPLATICRPMKEGLSALLQQAQAEAGARTDITARQLLELIGCLPKDPCTGATVEPYLDIVLAGLTEQPSQNPPPQARRLW